MLKKSVQLTLFLTLVLMLSACKSRKIASDSANLLKAKKSEVIGFVNANHLDYKTLEIKSKLELKNTKTYKAKGIFRLKKDECIWASIQFLGIEAARLFVDSNSVQVLDKLNKTHYSIPFDTLEARYGVSLQVSDLQHLILAESVRSLERNTQLTRLGNQLKLHNKKNKAVYFLSLILENKVIVEQTIEAKNSTFATHWQYSKERLEHGVPMETTLSIALKKPIRLNIKPTKISLNSELKTPFKVHSKYETQVF